MAIDLGANLPNCRRIEQADWFNPTPAAFAVASLLALLALLTPRFTTSAW